MKTTLRLILLLNVVVLLSACKKDETNAKLYITALKNDSKFEVTNPIFYYDSDSIRFNGYDGSDEFTISIKKGSGISGNGAINAHFFNTVGYDALSSQYKLANNSENVVNIKTYDTDNNVLDGTFDLILEKVSGSSQFPDILHFRNGRIKAQLKPKPVPLRF